MNLFSRRPLALLSLLLLFSSLITLLLNRNGIMRLFALIPFLLFAVVAFALALRRKKRRMLPLLAATALLLGFLTQAAYDDIRHRPWREADAGILHGICARVDASNGWSGGEGSYTVTLTKLDGEDVRLRLLLEAKTEDPIPVGSSISCRVLMRGWADAYQYGEGIAGTAEASGTPTILEKTPEKASPVATLRTAVSCRIREGTNGDAAALFSALLLGEKALLSEKITTDFKRTGLSHTLALSGLHLSVLALSLLWLLRRLRLPTAVTYPILFAFLLLYAAISGFPPSLLRASIMLLVAELARALRLLPDAITSLFFAVAMIVLLSPASVADVGLLLSFLATLGILVALSIFPEKRSHAGRLARASRMLLLSLLSSLFAILSTLLVTSLVFGHFSLIAPLTNLLFSPLIHLALLIAPLLLLSPSLIGPIAEWLATALLDGVSFFSNWRGVYVTTDYPLFLVALLLFSLYFVGLLLRNLGSRQAFLLRFFAAFSILVAVFLGCHLVENSRSFMLYTHTPSNECLTFKAEGEVTVVCTSDKLSGITTLPDALKKEGITEVDTLVLTAYDPHTLHELDRLLVKMPIRTVCLAATERINEDGISALRRLLDARGVGYTALEGGTFSRGALTLRPVTEITLSSEDVVGCFLIATYRGVEVRYASRGALSAVNRTAAEAFVRTADLLILGGEPSFSIEEPPLLLPPGCTLLAAEPATVPAATKTSAAEIVESPVSFRYPLK